MNCPRCGQENPDGFRFCGSCGAPLVADRPARELRKTVTVLFCDVTGSTAMGERLDPESTRRVMARYFDVTRAAIERHGGTVEKFIGDAVMAVFGIPVVHEDDALRAVRAAVDMRQALAELNDELERGWGVRIESRIGVNTGEVVAGEGEALATGDAVNVAARLEQLAAPGETLLGESTHRLVRDAVTAEPVEPLAAKGKSEPIAAFRLTGLVAGGELIPRRLDSPLVGRENELAQLQRAFDHAVSERVAYQFTLLGPAGIGKSRLVHELCARVDARVLRGRCLPYGEGITYWPLAELEPLTAEIDFDANRDEIALQTRRILERLAREHPLVVVFDDLQWAEPTFLDLVDHVTDLARDAPMLLVCVARPDLLDVRSGWGGGKLNATTMLLEALTAPEAAQLVDNLLSRQIDSVVKERIAAAGEGNPLFLEEMLAIVAESENGELVIPPTIQALLAARLDRLAPEERTTIECAAVQGQEFRLEALADLVSDSLAERLVDIHQSLVRKDVVRPTGDETSTFKHLLLRDAAYEGLPKERRADLHERLANWIEAADPELDEIRGYHLEQAHRYRTELGPVDERGREVARRAASLLAAAGQRAADRADISATVNLLERATRLLPDGDPEAVALYPDLAAAIVEGGDLPRADELYHVAEALGDEVTKLRARLRRIWLGLLRGDKMADSREQLEAVCAEAEQLGERSILSEALIRLGAVAEWTGEHEQAKRLLQAALGHAEAAGDQRYKSEAVIWLGVELMWGPTPVEEALHEAQRLAESSTGANSLAQLLVVQGALTAMTGNYDEGRKLAGDGLRIRRELGMNVAFAALTMPAAMIDLLAGDNVAADTLLLTAHRVLEPSGERGYLSTVLGMRAVALARQQRFAEADTLADESRRAGNEDDLITQLYWRMAKAQTMAAGGRLDEARRLAKEVADLSADHANFDVPIAILEVADLLAPSDARPALERALAGAQAKGNVVIAEKARAKLEALP